MRLHLPLARSENIGQKLIATYLKFAELLIIDLSVAECVAVRGMMTCNCLLVYTRRGLRS